LYYGENWEEITFYHNPTVYLDYAFGPFLPQDLDESQSIHANTNPTSPSADYLNDETISQFTAAFDPTILIIQVKEGSAQTDGWVPHLGLPSQFANTKTILNATKSRELPVVVDLGASCSITPCKEDFVCEFDYSLTHIRGLNGTAEINGYGLVKWHILDVETNAIGSVLTPAYYVPSAEIRLLSPQ
jgi:hypothetical protein